MDLDRYDSRDFIHRFLGAADETTLVGAGFVPKRGTEGGVDWPGGSVWQLGAVLVLCGKLACPGQPPVGNAHEFEG